MRPTVLDVGVGGEVKHEAGAFHRRGQGRQIEVVAADELETRLFHRAVEEAELTGAEVVPACDCDAIRQQAIDERGADEAGGAGDKNVVHGFGRTATQRMPAG
ncbi:MAG: hypothetical protein WDM96_18650 [Lacunisphaera sp.]